MGDVDVVSTFRWTQEMDDAFRCRCMDGTCGRSRCGWVIGVEDASRCGYMYGRVGDVSRCGWVGDVDDLSTCGWMVDVDLTRCG